MSKFTLYHNPRCSKSREALRLLHDNNVDFQVIHYLDNPLTTEQIAQLLTKLKLAADALIRKNEALYQELNLQNAPQEQLIIAMSEHPKLIERPIIADDKNAVIARPPTKVLDFIQ